MAPTFDNSPHLDNADAINNVFAAQESQYSFPYHYIPFFDENGNGSIHRTLVWGLEYLCYQRHIKLLVESLNPKSVLEVGCGDGHFIGLLSNEIPRKMGIDLVARAIQFARAFHPDIEFAAMDADDVDEQFDLVAAVEVLEHIPDERLSAFFRSLAARVVSGGSLVVSVPTTVTAVSKKHYRHYTIAMLKEQLAVSGAPLQLVHSEYVYRESALINFYRRFSSNRLWSLEIKALRRSVWRYVWTRLRRADATSGRHMVVLLERL